MMVRSSKTYAVTNKFYLLDLEDLKSAFRREAPGKAVPSGAKSYTQYAIVEG